MAIDITTGLRKKKDPKPRYLANQQLAAFVAINKQKQPDIEATELKKKCLYQIGRDLGLGLLSPAMKRYDLQFDKILGIYSEPVPIVEEHKGIFDGIVIPGINDEPTHYR